MAASVSRRELTQSTSSSRSDRTDRTASAQQPSPSSAAEPRPAVESAVTRLLVSIKQLLEALTNWSQNRIDENAVSDVYVELGNNFNSAVSAFGSFGIDMSELLNVPNDLRNVLEQCLAEDATEENLEIYLPTVRNIITSLLHGLRGKQSIFRRIASDKHRSERSDRGDRSSRTRSHRTQPSRSGGDITPEGASGGSGSSNRNSRRDKSTTRRATSSSQSSLPLPNGSGGTPGPEDENSPSSYTTFVGGFAPINGEDASYRSSTSQPPPEIPPQELPPRVDSVPREEIRPPATPPPVPSNVKRYSLVDKPMPPSSPPPTLTVTADPEDLDATETLPNTLSSIPPPPPIPPSPTVSETPLPFDTNPPAMANSLAALKKSDTLERRASKRFSTYNISKMTSPSSSKDKERAAVSLRDRGNRRSLAAGAALTAGELAVLTEEDEGTPDREDRSVEVTREPSGSGRRSPGPSMRSSMKRPVSKSKLAIASGPADVEEPPPVPRTPAAKKDVRTVSPAPESAPSSPAPTAPSLPAEVESPLPPRTPGRFKVFLQLGREVKKAQIEPGLSFPALRVLFVDKFSYNPGLENFPAIYIRDPSSGVQYELEDVDEVKEGCLLSLNIEPLDQIRQHIDAQIGALSQDLKDIKTAVANQRMSSTFMPPSPIVGHPLAESTPASRPTDRQFQHVARRLSKFIGSSSNSMNGFGEPVPPLPFAFQQQIQPQMTGASTISEYSSRVVTDLKTQFDEVQNLRRDLGIMRQLYTEFMKTTKDSLSTLRSQTQSVKTLANTKVGGARAYIDSGKKKLDVRSQDVLTQIEKLQDTVEVVRDDVLKRHITPKPQSFKNLGKDIKDVETELESLRQHIQTIKPMWKKTWEEELQNIVEEQQFLVHQEEFLNDLLGDHKDVQEVYEKVAQVVSLKSQKVYKPGFRPPPPEEGHEGLSTVLKEIRGAQFDPDKRMKAIEANQRNRKKELEASNGNELQSELREFVDGKKLKLTGGAEEAERVRQKRNDMTLKAMFTGDSVFSQ